MATPPPIGTIVTYNGEQYRINDEPLRTHEPAWTLKCVPDFV